MKRYSITVLADAHEDLRIPAAQLLNLIAAILDGTGRAARFEVEGRGSRPGPAPQWLKNICAVDVVGLRNNCVSLDIEAPTLAEANPAIVDQSTFFPGDESIKLRDLTGMDLFGRVLRQASRGDKHVRADRSLLEACAYFARQALSDRVEIRGLADDPQPIEISTSSIQEIERLLQETPLARAARLTGVLDTVSAESRKDVYLLVGEAKEKVKVLLNEGQHEVERLRELFGKRVVVSGSAHFRPSGDLLRLDAEDLEEASEPDLLWQQIPMAMFDSKRPVFVARAQDSTSGVSSFFGIWPGDESEDELLHELSELE